ncbi:uncharacterized [Tachysurus ichikawai]
MFVLPREWLLFVFLGFRISRSNAPAAKKTGVRASIVIPAATPITAVCVKLSGFSASQKKMSKEKKK